MNKRNIKIFWCHPQLRDYRLPFFNIMNKKYTITFFFQKKYDIRHNLDCYYSKKNSIAGFRPNQLTIKDLRELYRNIKKSDIFITSFTRSIYSSIGIIVARALGKRVIVWEEWMNIRKNKIKYKIRDNIAIKMFNCIDAMYVLGKAQKETLITLGYPRNNIFEANEYPGYKYNTIPPKFVKLPFKEGVKIVLYLGRLIECKGVIYLIKAFHLIEKTNKNAALLIVGIGQEKGKLINTAKKLNIKNIYFAGSITDLNQKSYIFKRSSVAVVPSIITSNKSDPGPLVTLEILSSGTPLVISAAVGNAYFVKDGINGYVFPQRDINALYKKIKYILDNDNILREEILYDFSQIRNHEYQAEQIEKAIEFVMNKR